MAISFGCPGCSTPFNVGTDMAGKKAKCPKCLLVFTVPEPAAAPAAPTAPPPWEERPKPRRTYDDDERDKVRDPDDRPRSRPSRDDEDDDVQPRRKKARRK